MTSQLGFKLKAALDAAIIGAPDNGKVGRVITVPVTWTVKDEALNSEPEQETALIQQLVLNTIQSGRQVLDAAHIAFASGPVKRVLDMDAFYMLVYAIELLDE